MSLFREITSGLAFPEGPIAMPDGSVIVVEMFGPYLTKVHSDGQIERLATVTGGPNGVAIGPDGRIYICNNGAAFDGIWRDGNWDLWYSEPARYCGGSIQAFDMTTRELQTIYTACDGLPLSAPNDLVFDQHGGFYFSDLGYLNGESPVVTAVYYAHADGSSIRQVSLADLPNGVGLSPDGKTLYWNETPRGRIMRAPLAAPGVLSAPGQLHYQFAEGNALDSLAIDGDGNICTAVLGGGAIGVVSPTGQLLDFYHTGNSGTTNICFGGIDLRTAYVTLGGSGALVAMQWPRPGLPLAYL
ncbi:MAG: SMP-30/gluconolactonase/LRE family protein [Chloroflexales bacterium]|nr:SMP-30/gluconolactonase/LRE family protein [Chloroflexales bacterium]